MAVRLSWLEHAYSRPLAILTRKVGEAALVFGVRSGFKLASLCVHRLRFVLYRLTSIHAQTHRQTDGVFTTYMNSSSS